MLTGLAHRVRRSAARVGTPSLSLLLASKKYPAGAANFTKLLTCMYLVLVLEYVLIGAGYPRLFTKYPVVSLASVVL